MQARATSGLTEEDIKQTKIYMRTFNDAVNCTKDIAQKEAAKAHYKHYVKLMLDNQGPHLILDKDKNVVSTSNMEVYQVFRQATFCREVADRYGLAKETIKDRADLDQRLDRAIKGLETEVALKQAHCHRLLDQLRMNETQQREA